VAPEPHVLKRVQQFPCKAEEVFSFFQMPENLALITPSWLDFRILTPPPVIMSRGTVIDYTIRWMTVPVRWTTLITAYDPPHLFVDEQIRGPYTLWEHTHSFREREGWTEMTDQVRYRLPFGLLGRVAHALFIRHQLEAIFDHRSRVIGQMFGLDAGRQERLRPTVAGQTDVRSPG